MKLQQAVSATDETIGKDRQMMNTDFRELVNTLNATNEVLLSRKITSDRQGSNRNVEQA